MTRSILFLLIFICLPPDLVNAYRLKGLIVKDHEAGHPIPGVKINSDGAQPTVSTSSGLFELHFIEKRPGDKVRLILEKGGMEVVNREILQLVLCTNEEELIIIIMCKDGQRDIYAPGYYRINVNLNTVIQEVHKVNTRDRKHE